MRTRGSACVRFVPGVKKTKLQMLFRGQNILGYRHYADDVVEYFVQKSIANGIDIIRIFDALNDPRNLETAIKAALKEGGHVQAAISATPPVPMSYDRVLPQLRQAAGGDGRKFHLHQGYGGSAQAV